MNNENDLVSSLFIAPGYLWISKLTSSQEANVWVPLLFEHVAFNYSFIFSFIFKAKTLFLILNFYREFCFGP